AIHEPASIVRDAPDAESLICGGGYQALAIGAKCHTRHRVGVAGQGTDIRAGLDQEQEDPAVRKTGRHKLIAVAEGDAAHLGLEIVARIAVLWLRRYRGPGVEALAEGAVVDHRAMIVGGEGLAADNHGPLLVTDRRSRLDVPEPEPMVGAARGERRTVRTEGDAHDVAGMSGHRRAVELERIDGGQVDLAVLAAPGDQFAIRAERDAVRGDLAIAGRDRIAERLARRGVPQPNAAIHTRRRQRRAVRADGHALDRGYQHCRNPDRRLARAHVPEEDAAVVV